jgi:hypothetical protein
VGRFLQRDPIPLTLRSIQELNAYSYVANNPLRFTDPDGLNIHGNWCGPGGSGAPKDSVDACCMNHDKCFDKGGATWKDHTFGTRDSMKQECMNDCDKKICDCLLRVVPKTPDEKRGRIRIIMFFDCGEYPILIPNKPLDSAPKGVR